MYYWISLVIDLIQINLDPHASMKSKLREPLKLTTTTPITAQLHQQHSQGISKILPPSIFISISFVTHTHPDHTHTLKTTSHNSDKRTITTVHSGSITTQF